MIENRRYPLHQSRLYKVKSPAQLASILGLTRSDVQLLLSMNDNYIRFDEKKSGRAIQWPKPKLRAVHKRISIFLSRITAHKTKLFRSGQVRVVTGVAITREGNRVPNRRQKVIAEDTSAFHSAASDAEKLEIGRRLMSRLFEAASVDESWLARAKEMQRTCARLKRLVDA